jgi:hypothetical protein
MIREVVGVQMTRGTGVWQRVEKGGQAPRCDVVFDDSVVSSEPVPVFQLFSIDEVGR